MLVDAFNYTVPSLLNQFLCDNAIIDKTLFYLIKRYSIEIVRRKSVKFGADLEHIINLAEVKRISIYHGFYRNYDIEKLSLFSIFHFN
jgi:hypothetical protein